MTITANVSPFSPFCALFGQTGASPATVSFRLDTCAPIFIPAGTLIGPSVSDLIFTDLYGYQKSVLSAISASYGTKTWNADDVADGPLGGYPPNPSATVWFNGPVTVGGDALPTMVFDDSDGRLETAPLFCGVNDFGGGCGLVDRMDIVGGSFSCFGIGDPLNISVVKVSESEDADCDGVPDNVDQCPNSDLSATVVIDGCNSGVSNIKFPTGCTISDLIAECATGASRHGQFTSCVDSLTVDLKKAGTITGRQKGAIISCAAK